MGALAPASVAASRASRPARPRGLGCSEGCKLAHGDAHVWIAAPDTRHEEDLRTSCGTCSKAILMIRWYSVQQRIRHQSASPRQLSVALCLASQVCTSSAAHGFASSKLPQREYMLFPGFFAQNTS